MPPEMTKYTDSTIASNHSDENEDERCVWNDEVDKE
jgi:hypothetical protein